MQSTSTIATTSTVARTRGGLENSYNYDPPGKLLEFGPRGYICGIL